MGLIRLFRKVEMLCWTLPSCSPWSSWRSFCLYLGCYPNPSSKPHSEACKNALSAVCIACFKGGRRCGRGSPKLSWPIFPKYYRICLGNWGLRPQFLRLFLEYSGNIGQLSLGNPLPYLLPYLKKAFECCVVYEVFAAICSTSSRGHSVDP